jgi:hypothetical protein
MTRLLFVWLIGCGSALAAQATLYPEDQPVTLNGLLKVVQAYGPPGYGLMPSTKSQDAKITYWALELPFEVTLPCRPDSPELADIQCGSTKRVRLLFKVGPETTSMESKARTMINRKVTIRGKLHRRTQMIDMTPVYMDVADIDLRI